MTDLAFTDRMLAKELGLGNQRSLPVAVANLLVERKVQAKGWGPARRVVAVKQLVMNQLGIPSGAVDGLVGPQTEYAAEAYAHRYQHGEMPAAWRDTAEAAPPLHSPPSSFPREVDARRYFGPTGRHLAKLRLPYLMVLSWDPKVKLRHITMHELLVPSAGRVLERVLDHYGPDGIKEHGLDQFGGCLNVRKKRGGTQWSIHSWGAAIDFDPERNRLRWGRDKAHLASAECARFLDLWEEEGWVSLGRARNFDWMHVQAARP